MSYETKLLWKKRLLMLWCCFVDVHNLMMPWVPPGFRVDPGLTTPARFLGSEIYIMGNKKVVQFIFAQFSGTQKPNF